MYQQKGVSLLIVFLVMTVILAIVLNISVILVNEIKIISGIGNSVVSFYAADTGIEKTLYFDRKQVTNGAIRGFCNICTACKNDINDPNGDFATHCNNCALSGSSCGVNSCASCLLSYNSAFLGKTYTVSATVTPNANPSLSDFSGSSRGVYNDVARQIQLNSQLQVP